MARGLRRFAAREKVPGAGQEASSRRGQGEGDGRWGDGLTKWHETREWYCGWLRTPNHQLIGVLWWFIIPLFIGFRPCKVVQDFATIHSIMCIIDMNYEKHVYWNVWTCEIDNRWYLCGDGALQQRQCCCKFRHVLEARQLEVVPVRWS